MANYRIKPPVTGNVYPDVRINGMFAIDGSTAALGTIVRPSAGSGASAGVGELFTVTVPTAGTFLWKVALAEQYFAPVWVKANVMLVPTSDNAGTATTFPTVPSAPLKNNANNSAIHADVTFVDVPIDTGATDGSNTFYIFLTDGAGLIPTSALTVPSGYTAMVAFEACFKNSVAPVTL